MIKWLFQSYPLVANVSLDGHVCESNIRGFSFANRWELHCVKSKISNFHSIKSKQFQNLVVHFVFTLKKHEGNWRAAFANNWELQDVKFNFSNFRM